LKRNDKIYVLLRVQRKRGRRKEGRKGGREGKRVSVCVFLPDGVDGDEVGGHDAARSPQLQAHASVI